MSTEEMLLEVKNLSKQFGGIKAVDNVNLQIRKGVLVISSLKRAILQ